MRTTTGYAPLALLLASSAVEGHEAVFSKRQDDSCQDVHVFLAKGNNEPEPGRQGALVEAICGGLDSCDYEDIHFDNALETPYCESLNNGAINGNAQITAYNERCPDTKLVVSGYSQGAHVVGDILGGGGGVFFEECVQNTNAGLNPNEAPGNMIYAALLWGDTRHTASQSYNYESGAGADGLFPRSGEQLAGLNGFADVLRDYCVSSDPICAGGDIVQNHLNYFDIYPEDAASWVWDMLGDDSEQSSTTSSSAASTTTSASASSTDSTSTSETTVTSTSGSTASSTSSGSSTSGTASTTSASTTQSSTVTSAASTTSSPSETEESAAPSPTDEDSAAAPLSVPAASLFCVGLAFFLWA